MKALRVLLAWRSRLWRGALRQRDRLLLGAAALALLACFWRPEWTVQRRLYEHVVVFDITQSMNVLDQFEGGRPVSRLQHAKAALRQALVQLPCGSKLGLGVFTEYRSYLLLTPVEVCANRRELRATLDAIDGRMAWVGGSEIAKGLHSGLATVKQLPGVPALVFVTDGQESPPLNPRHRPAFDDKPGEVQGLIVGVGGLQPVAIPKRDPMGRPLGVWRAEDVAQTDPRSQGRGASVSGEALVESDAAVDSASAGLGATPGSEHLSALREGYLQLLASERGLQYLQLDTAAALSRAMLDPAQARPVPAQADLRVPLALFALLLLLARHWPAGGENRRR